MDLSCLGRTIYDRQFFIQMENNHDDGKKKKKKIRNIKDGKIVVAEREGRDKTDTYYKRSRSLVKAAESLHVITGAHVKAEIVPTWPQGIRRQYVSAGFPLPEIEVVEGEPLIGESFLDLAAPTGGGIESR